MTHFSQAMLIKDLPQRGLPTHVVAWITEERSDEGRLAV